MLTSGGITKRLDRMADAGLIERLPTRAIAEARSSA